MLPYYIYAAVSVSLIVVFTVFSFENYDIRQYTIGHVMRILCTIDIPQMPHIAHLWFIIPYMILLSTFGIQKRMIKTYRWRYCFGCIFVFVMSQIAIIIPDLVKTILGYNIFLVAGYFLYKHTSIQQVVGILVCSLAIIVLLLSAGVRFHSMQIHKFPPDLLFVSYGSAILCVLSLMLWKFRAPDNMVFKEWNRKGFTIYLYQNFAFYILDLLRVNFLLFFHNVYVDMFVSIVAAFILSSFLVYITYPIEQFVVNLLILKK